jgi:hypothetical protein
MFYHQQALPPQVGPFLNKWLLLVKATSVEDVIDRLLELLINMEGIKCHYEDYKFRIWTTSYSGIVESCGINIYLNSGEYQKSESTCLNIREIISDENIVQQFAVEFDYTSRYFSELFRYIEKNFSIDIIEPFSNNDLNYGLYLSSLNESEMDIKQTKRRRITMSRRTRRRMRRNRKARKNRF